MDNEFVLLQKLAVLIEIIGLKLDNVIGETTAGIAESNDPDRFVCRDIDSELDIADLDVLFGIRPAQPVRDTAAVSADRNDENNRYKNPSTSDSPFAGAQKL